MTEEIKNKLQIHYLKTSNFDTRLATGVIGGVNVLGMVDMNFYVDRAVIPQIQTHAVNVEENTEVLGELIDQQSKKGIVREVHSGIVLDLNTAKSLVDWLQKQIIAIENANNKKK